MKKLLVETFNTKENETRCEFGNTILWLLNRLNTRLIVTGDSSQENEQTISPEQRKASTALLLNACATGNNIIKALEPLSLCSKDALPLARTFYESILDACFLLSDDGARAKRALLYTTYKLFKTQATFYKLGNSKGIIRHPISLPRSHPLVKEALATFEPNGSTKPRKCFSESRSQKIAAIRTLSDASSIMLEGVEQMNWEHASEIAHGSLFSHQMLSGLFEEPREITFSEGIGAKAIHALVLCSNAIATLVHKYHPDWPEIEHLMEACALYYQEEVPELSLEIRPL